MKRRNHPYIQCLLVIISTWCGLETAIGQNPEAPKLKPSFLTESHSFWADSVMEFMPLNRQIAQLLMPPVYSQEDTTGWSQAESWAETFGIGGVICMQGHPAGQVERIRRLQAKAQVPLLVSIDGEWGLGMRLDSTRSWPRALTFGAARNVELTETFGKEVGKMLQSVGVHVNFAPVVDVNSNPSNPVIGSRSFGEDVSWVSQLGAAYARGLQASGVLATAKHFPGHGDTDSDSHLTLPSVLHDTTRLRAVELAPFQFLKESGVGAMMSTHLYVPSLDATDGRPSTLSPYIIDTLLRKEIGFQGLVFTDAMTMKGFTDFAQTDQPYLDALVAGNDVLLFPGEPGAVIREIQNGIATGVIDSLFIAAKCKRVLQAKSWCKVWQIPQGYQDTPEAEQNHLDILASALTVVKNKGRGLPLSADVRSIQSIMIGWETAPSGIFQAQLERTMGTAVSIVNEILNPTEFARAAKSKFRNAMAARPDWLFIHIGGTSHRIGKGYGVSEEEVEWLEWCAAQAESQPTRLGVILYGSPYILDRLTSTAALADALIIAYQDDARTQRVVADALSGSGPANGYLPVSAGTFELGTGIPWSGRERLGYAPVSFSGSAVLDSLAINAIAAGATPGCRLVVAHRGKIIHDGSYGTTDGQTPVHPHTLYDLASITKVAASVLALMHLEEAQQLSRKSTLENLLPELSGTELGTRSIEDILAHRAGLQAWIPFYLEALEDSTAFVEQTDSAHPLPLSAGCSMRLGWQDSIWQKIISAPLDPVGTHRYSDLGYYMLQRAIERITASSLDHLTDSLFYSPMGWKSLGYHPLNHHSLENIAPTEHDELFRKALVHGTVHDPGAAMLGGVAGHAGLFGDAYDVSRLMYMLRLGGYYGRHALFKAQTIQNWTQRVDEDTKHRKACGFDRPDAEPDAGPTCDEATWSSFGHSGFTGTLAWADPDADVVFVFLSNRVFPSAENRQLIELNVRTEMQHVVYKHLGISSRFELNPS